MTVPNDDDAAQQLAATLPASAPLDRSYASLDRLEDAYLAAPTAHEVVAQYVGATLIARAHGRWDPPRSTDDDGQPCVTGLPHLGPARFRPHELVRALGRARTPGLLRDETERYDIALRRQVCHRVSEHPDDELAAFAIALRDELGRDPGPLDGSAASLATVEDGLAHLITDAAPRERCRRMRHGAVVYLGALVRASIGGEWSVCERPDHAQLGQLQIHGWAPMSVVHNIGVGHRPGTLSLTLGRVLKRGRR